MGSSYRGGDGAASSGLEYARSGCGPFFSRHANSFRCVLGLVLWRHAMKLYQFPLSPNCQKVVAIAHEVGLPLEIVNVDLFKGQARTPELLAKNPNGRVPVLEDDDFVLWESNAILGYV